MGDERAYPPSVGKSGPQGLPDDRSEYLQRQASASWDKVMRESPLQRLKYYDAKLARAGFSSDPAERERLKSRVAELIREAGASNILAEPDVICMVRELFGEKGVQRLRDRARTTPHQTEPHLVADMAHPVHQRGKA